MTTVYIVRHAEAEGNIYRRIHGQYNSNLTEKGLLQVAALEERFRPIHLDAVYSSDLRRCRKTARALYEPKGLPLYLNAGLREMNMGQWEDKPWGEIGRLYPEAIHGFQTCSRSFRAPGGESFLELRARMRDTIFRLAARHEGQTIAVSTHYIALRAALSAFWGFDVEEIPSRVPMSDNTAVSCLQVEGREAKVLFACDNSHLTEDLSTLNGQKWKKDGSIAAPESNLWYRPWDPEGERELYLRFRRETWEQVHPGVPFDAEGFYRDAARCAAQDPWAVVCAMQGNAVAGLLQMDLERYRAERAGFIFFYYMTPQAREQGLGIQLLGQAISTFRPLGCTALRLRCAPDNALGLPFYLHHGFVDIGTAQTEPVELRLLEKSID